MKRCFCLIAATLAAAATPALASEASPSAPPALRLPSDRPITSAMSEQVRQGLARLREALEARKRDAKQGAPAAQQEANGLCYGTAPTRTPRPITIPSAKSAKPTAPEYISQADQRLNGRGAVRVTSHRSRADPPFQSAQEAMPRDKMARALRRCDRPRRSCPNRPCRARPGPRLCAQMRLSIMVVPSLALLRLTPREEHVIRLRYGIGGLGAGHL